MENILDKIIAKKREDIRNMTELTINDLDLSREKRSFIKKLKNSSEMSIISEFKRASPS
jgi:indole-3-glycerol phosphate synthase